jgi:hypothetical protein
VNKGKSVTGESERVPIRVKKKSETTILISDMVDIGCVTKDLKDSILIRDRFFVCTWGFFLLGFSDDSKDMNGAASNWNPITHFFPSSMKGSSNRKKNLVTMILMTGIRGLVLVIGNRGKGMGLVLAKRLGKIMVMLVVGKL